MSHKYLAFLMSLAFGMQQTAMHAALLDHKKKIIAGASLLAGVGAVAYKSIDIMIAPGSAMDNKMRSALRNELDKVISGVEKVEFLSADKKTVLSGVVMQRTHAAGTLVFCHGYRGGKEDLYNRAALFPDHNLLFFDFRGHGDSHSSYITIGDLESFDVEGAVAFAKLRFPDAPLGIVGLSMGAAATLKALSRTPNLCDAVALDSGYANLREMIGQIFLRITPINSFSLLNAGLSLAGFRTGCKFDVNPEAYIAELQIPAMIIHSDDDGMITPEHANRLCAAAKKGTDMVKSVWRCKQAPHACISHYFPGDYSTRVGDFFKKFLVTSL